MSSGPQQKDDVLSRPMFYRNLPDELNPGRVQLRPLGSIAAWIVPCEACNEFSPKGVTPSCGHRLCSGCCVGRETTDGIILHRCPICNEKSIGEFNELDESHLRALRSACSCGLEGTLEEIRDHLFDDDSVNHLYDELSVSGQILKASGGGQPPVRSLPSSATSTSSAAVANQTSVAYICIEVASKIRRHAKTGIIQQTKGVSWLAAGYPVEFICQIESIKGTSYLGAYIRLRNDKPAFTSWPMKKRITFRLHNRNGDIIKRKSLVTFRDGLPEDEQFVYACDPGLGRGFRQLSTIADLMSDEAGVLCKGTVGLSVEFQDLPES